MYDTSKTSSKLSLMKKNSLAVFLLSLVFLCLACQAVKRYGKRPEPHPQDTAAEEKRRREPEKRAQPAVETTGGLPSRLKIGVVLPLSGELSGFGQAVLEGLLIARDEFKSELGEEIEFELVDNEENYRIGSVRSIEIAKRLKDEGVIAVVGPLTTPSLVSTALTLSSDSILVLSPSSSAYDLPQVAANAFSLNMPSPSLSRKIARFATRELDLTSFAVLYPGNLYGHVMTESFIEEVELQGGNVMVVVSFSPSQKTFENEIKTIALYRPDALFIPARSEDVIQIAPQVPYYGLYEVVLLGVDGWNYDDVTRKGGTYVEGVYFADSFFPESPELIYDRFSESYIRLYRKEPTRIAAWGYDALAMIVEAHEEGGDRAGALLEAFRGMKRFKGSTAIYSMVDGRIEREGFLFTISGGEIESLEYDTGRRNSHDTQKSHGGLWNENGG